MQFEVYRDNGGQFHWRLGGEGVTVAVSAAKFTTEQAARESADAIRADTGLPDPSRRLDALEADRAAVATA